MDLIEQKDDIQDVGSQVNALVDAIETAMNNSRVDVCATALGIVCAKICEMGNWSIESFSKYVEAVQHEVTAVRRKSGQA